MRRHASNDTIARLISTLNVYLASVNRQNTVASICQNNVTLIWFNSNSTTPILAFSKPSLRSARSDEQQQLEAVMYIVVVLMFYSITIAVAMIKYMHQESQQANEDQMYQDFLSKTKQLAMQQAKKDFARRVSIQLVAMSQSFNGRQSVVMSRRVSTLPALEEIDPDAEHEDDQSFDARSTGNRKLSVYSSLTHAYGGSTEAISGFDEYRVSTASDGHSWSTTLNCPSVCSPSLTPPEAKNFAGSVQKLSVL